MNYYLKKLIHFPRYYELKTYKKIYKENNSNGISVYETTQSLLDKPIIDIGDLEKELADRIKNGDSFLLARLGNTEGTVLGQYLGKKYGVNRTYSSVTRDWLYSTSGFFADDYPDEEIAMDEYAKLTLRGLKDCDYLCARWPDSFYQPFFFKHYARKAVPTSREIWPYEKKTEDKWYSGLEGKKVLVINSFADSIALQYARKG